MSLSEKNLYPVFDRALSRSDREKVLKQRSVVVWFTGLSGAGKTTLSLELEKQLFARGYICQLLDGDNIRTGISSNLGFSEEDRLENIRRIAEVSKLFKDSGIIILAAFVSPTHQIRQLAMDIIGHEDFIEIFVNPPIEVCEERDVKGLYKKARTGEIKNFTGISSPFEPPTNPTLNLDTSQLSINQSLEKILENVLPRIAYS